MSKTRMSRRLLLGATMLGSSAIRASANPVSSSRTPAMSHSTRTATPSDLADIVALLMEDARARNALDARLWRLAADTRARIERAVGAALGKAGESWLVAEHTSRIVGIIHGMIVPVPPIYDDAAGAPGLFMDDCFVSADAPTGTAEALLVATEAGLRNAGAARLVASCPAAGLLRPLYERHGYEPVTLYMGKHGFRASALTPGARQAQSEDVPDIVKLSARHRRTLAELPGGFWHIHRDADDRFDAWMRRSLTFTDRDMLVAGAPGTVRGYAIAQPCSPLLVPAAHDVTGIGVIDDFYDEDFGNVTAVSNSGASGASLLAAAEGAFARRGIDSTLVVCPAAWSSKISLLEQSGFRTAKLWMLKR